MLISNFAVVGLARQLTKTGSPYAVLKLKGFLNELPVQYSVSVWGFPENVDLYKHEITISVKEQDGFKSAKYQEILYSAPISENSPLLQFYPQIPTEEEWGALCQALLKKFTFKDDYAEFIKSCFSDLYPKYVKHPAAKSNHHAYEGGLLEHTYQLLNMFLGICDSLPFEIVPEAVILGCLYHDYGKMFEYKNGTYTENMALLGHIYMSSYHLQSRMQKSGLFKSDHINYIIHTILAHHSKLEWGSPVVPATTEAFLVHHLDMISGHGVAFENSEHMEKSFPLGCTVVKPKHW